MDADDDERDAQAVGAEMLESLTGVIAVGTLGVGVLSAVLGYGGLTALIFVVGWLLLLPLAGVLAENTAVQSFVGRSFGGRERASDSEAVEDDEAALKALKERYARGEIDEAEFEHRTALLLENESIDDVRDRVDREPARASDPRERDTNGADREREYET
jgi:uncharacterized membrane protein